MSAIVPFDGWDLDTTSADEPRVRDLDVARRAGLAKPLNIRATIERNWEELTAHGEIKVFTPRVKTSGGRPGTEYWLNEAQAVALVALMKTTEARALRIGLVRLFVAWRRGHLAASTVASAPIQARIGDDPRAKAQVRALSRAAARHSGLSTHRIQGGIRKPWGVISIYRIALSALDHTIAQLMAILAAPPPKQLPADRRQMTLFGKSERGSA